MARDFKWCVCICDDEPNESPVQKTYSALENIFNCTIISSRNDFLDKQNQYKLINSHIVLMDMQWKFNFPQAPKAVSDFTYLPNVSKIYDKCTIVNDWISAVAAWSSNSKKPTTTLDQWPRYAIDFTDVGAWLGAMISHINPFAKIIFWSGLPHIFSQGLSAALGRYNNANYEVHTKDLKNGIEPNKLWPYLEPLQKRELQNDTFRQWFLKDVLLRLLANQKPNDCKVQLYIPASDDYLERNVSFNNFFPNLVGLDSRNDKLNHLQNYISSCSLKSEIIKAIQLVKHALKDFYDFDKLRAIGTISQDQNDPISKINLAIGAAILADEWGRSIVSYLYSLRQSIIASDCNAAIDALNTACFETYSIYKNARPYLKLCAQNYNGSYYTECSIDSEFRLNFPVYWLDKHILFHLNANKIGTESSSLKITECDKYIKIVWKSEWSSLNSHIDFWSIVSDSLKKGDSRGLPLVVLLCIESGANEFLIKAGNEWQQVWPPLDNLKIENDDFKFGIKLVFEKESRQIS